MCPRRRGSFDHSSTSGQARNLWQKCRGERTQSGDTSNGNTIRGTRGQFELKAGSTCARSPPGAARELSLFASRALWRSASARIGASSANSRLSTTDAAERARQCCDAVSATSEVSAIAVSPSLARQSGCSSCRTIVAAPALATSSGTVAVHVLATLALHALGHRRMRST